MMTIKYSLVVELSDSIGYQRASSAVVCSVVDALLPRKMMAVCLSLITFVTDV